MKRIALNAYPRSERGKGPNRRLRRRGRIPAILYGQESAPAMLAFDRHDFQLATSRLGDEMTMFTVSAAEAGIRDQLALIREVQRDPVTERIVHLDMMRVDPRKPIDVEVPVHPEGTPAGVREGGLLEHVTRSVRLRCLVDDVPDHVPVDISALSLGQVLHVSDLRLGDRIEILSPPTEVLFLVAVPRKEEEVAPAAAAVAAEGEAAEGAQAKPAEEGEGAEGKAKEETGKEEKGKEEKGREKERGRERGKERK